MSALQVGVVDYGMGNLHSVTRALEAAGAAARVIEAAAEFDGIGLLVLPGVGHFNEAMRRLEEKRLSEPLRAHVREGRPYLGLCLGLQLLFAASEEAPGVRGLDCLPGEVKRFPDEVKGERLLVPAIGWNRVKPTPQGRASLFAGAETKAGADYFYFVHSFYVTTPDPSLVAATTEYGVEYVSAVARPPLFAFQFHPEKSGEAGLALLRRILAAVG